MNYFCQNCHSDSLTPDTAAQADQLQGIAKQSRDARNTALNEASKVVEGLRISIIKYDANSKYEHDCVTHNIAAFKKAASSAILALKGERIVMKPNELEMKESREWAADYVKMERDNGLNVELMTEIGLASGYAAALAKCRIDRENAVLAERERLAKMFGVMSAKYMIDMVNPNLAFANLCEEAEAAIRRIPTSTRSPREENPE